MRQIDVYSYGIISPSTVYFLRDDFRFPEPNTYAEIGQTLPSIGGEAANSAIVLARLGLRTRLDGTWLNRRHAEEVRGRLAAFGIDVSRITATDTRATEEFVVADGHSRTVFGNYAGFFAEPQQWNEPCEEDIAEARIVCLDPYMGASSRRGAELCVAHGTPYVTQDSRYDDYVAQHAAAVAVSHELRGQMPGVPDRELFERYLGHCRGLVVFTFGGDEMWYGRQGGECGTLRPYEIEPVDSTGAGDSFRGALAYGLLAGWPDERTIDFASAVAACVCLSYPHALNAPDLDGVLAFMKEHGKTGRGGTGRGGTGRGTAAGT